MAQRAGFLATALSVVGGELTVLKLLEQLQLLDGLRSRLFWVGGFVSLVVALILGWRLKGWKAYVGVISTFVLSVLLQMPLFWQKVVLVLAPYEVDTHDALVYGVLRHFSPSEITDTNVWLYVAPEDGAGRYWLNRPANGSRIDENGNWQIECRFGDPDGVPMRRGLPLNFGVYAVASAAGRLPPTEYDKNYLEADGQGAFLRRLKAEGLLVSARFVVRREPSRPAEPLRFDAVTACGKSMRIEGVHAGAPLRVACSPFRLSWTQQILAVIQVNLRGNAMRKYESATWATDLALSPDSWPYELQLMRAEELSPNRRPVVLSSIWIQVEQPAAPAAAFDSAIKDTSRQPAPR